MKVLGLEVGRTKLLYTIRELASRTSLEAVQGTRASEKLIVEAMQ